MRDLGRYGCDQYDWNSTMAQKSTIFKAELQIADMERGYYGDHVLTLARHPSENDERLMVRLLAYALHAGGDGAPPLSFANGMTEMDEPDLWRKSYADEIELWIDVGQPDERWLRKASHRAREQVLYVYGRNGTTWWQANRAGIERLPGLLVLQVAADESAALAGLAERTMRLSCTVQEGHVWLGNGRATVQVQPAVLKEAQPR
jgi:uncharacterized protein YaeQ